MSVAWSYSSLSAFETCERRYQLTRVTKQVKEPQSQEMTHGNEVHKALEIAVAEQTPLPEKYKKYIPIVEAVRSAPGQKLAEMKFGLTQSYTPTGFFAKDVWLRGVLDLTVVNPGVVTVIDWKTGKPKSDIDQLKLFAGAAFALHPHAKTVKTGYAWLAYNKFDTEVFHRDDVPQIWQEFIPRVERLNTAMRTGTFLPKPSGLCGWCPVGSQLCEFWKGNKGAR